MAETIESISQAIEKNGQFKGHWIGYLFCKKNSVTFSVDNHYGIPGTDITKPVGELSFEEITDFEVEIDDLTSCMIDHITETRPGLIEVVFESGTVHIEAKKVHWLSYEAY